MKIKTKKIAMWSLLTALAMPFAAQVVDYDLSNAVRVMRGAATAINGATVGVVGNHNATITLKSGTATTTVALTGKSTDSTPFDESRCTLTIIKEQQSEVVARAEGRYSTGYGDYIYLTDKANGQVVRYDKNGTKSVYASVVGVGTAITSDDAGNLLVNKGFPNPASSTNWVIIEPNGTQTALTLEGFTAARVDDVGRVVGNVTSAQGGYLYLTPNNQNTVVAVKIANKAFVSAAVSPATDLTFNATSTAQPMFKTVAEVEAASNKACTAYFRIRTDKNIWSWNGTSLASLGAVEGATPGDGFDVFELNGVKYGVEPASGSNNFGDGIAIRNLSTNAVVASKNLNLVSEADPSFVSITARVNEDEQSVTIYQNLAGKLVAMYRWGMPEVATPTFTPDPSVTYTVEQAVAIACATSGATIYYTTDGSDPKTSATRQVYTGAIRVEHNTTIKAYAVKEGIDDSDVATANYTVNIPIVNDRHEPLGIEGVDYNGRATVQLSWTKPDSAYATPTGYNVYRDGELILSNILTTGYIDTNVPSGDHTYTVYSVYNGVEYTGGNATTDVDVSTFNTGNDVYKIEEVYNYVIGKDMPATDGSTYQDLDYRDYSRQGAVFAADRKWYIAMGAHQNSTTAGIFTCDIDDPRNTGAMLNLKAYSGYALPLCDHTYGIGKGQNPGIAFDSAGNMFVRGYYNRYSGSNSGAKPYYTNPATSASAYDVGVGLTHALVYKRNANGTYTTAPILVDMKGLKFDEQDTSDGRAQFIRAEGVGRSDFYTIEGNIFSTEGAKLYLSITQRAIIKEQNYGAGLTDENKPKSDRRFAVVNLKGSGSTVTASMSNSLTTSHKIVESEGYVLPIDSQSGKYIFERRGDKATIINSISGNTASEGATIQSGDPTNSSGGFTQKWDNDIIIGLPYSTAPANIGDFRLYLAHNGDLTDIRPLMDVQQSVRFLSPGDNSNSVWFYSEADTYDDESCIYIYMYAPGSRFAKYRLTRSGEYPMPEPTIKLVPKFGTSDNNGTRDLACYDAELSFERPVGTSATGHYENGDTRLTSYTVSVVDKNGNVVTDFNNVSYDDTSLAALEGAYSADNMSLPDMVNFDDASTYTFKILANYTTSSGKVKQSFERKATSDYTYSPNAPALTVVHNVARNVDFNQAWNANGENILVQEKFDIYRINIQLHNPEPVTSGDYTIPVSYYSLEVNKGDGNGWQPVQDYPQYVATDGYSVGPDGKIEVSTYGDHIAGDADLDDVSYEFYYFISHGRTYGPLRAVGDASDEDPSQWQYRLTANYGSSESVSYDGETYNPLSKGLAKSAYGEAVPSEEVTSVEFIQDCGSLRAYPIPTEGMLNIMSPIEITSIEFYSVSGALVKRVKGNGNNDATVDVSDLAAGTYIVSINGSMSLTIVKK